MQAAWRGHPERNKNIQPGLTSDRKKDTLDTLVTPTLTDDMVSGHPSGHPTTGSPGSL
jgi:hypothetical protein